jgi:SAM-dependent methyltransferase
MVAEANAEAMRNGVSSWTFHRVAAATALPFAQGSFDSVYSERLYQHLPLSSVELVVAETKRVLKPGGRAVVIDTDWATFSIDVDITVSLLERYITALHSRRFVNPYAGRQLFGLFREHGFTKISFELFNIPLDLPGVEVLLGLTVQQALASGLISQAQWNHFHQRLAERAAYGTFFAHLSMVAVTGCKD